MQNTENTHVLIIEDDHYSAQVLASMLDRMSVQYTILSDSRKVSEALEQLPRLKAIFVDLEMPGSNGYQVLKTIRDNPDYANVPVVAYTAHLSEMSKAREVGFHSFLGKPLGSAYFPAQLTSIFNNQPVWATREDRMNPREG